MEATDLDVARVVTDTRTWVDPNGRRLSDRLWKAREADRAAIDNLLRNAIASKNHRRTAVANLMRYIQPGEPGGLYAARRLLRTEVARATGEAVVMAAKRNPLTRGIKWNLSGLHTEADICDDRARRSSRGMGRGVYLPSEVPPYPGHPNCLCYLTTEYTDRRR